jgi:hypothetical protein
MSENVGNNHKIPHLKKVVMRAFEKELYCSIKGIKTYIFAFLCTQALLLQRQKSNKKRLCDKPCIFTF